MPGSGGGLLIRGIDEFLLKFNNVRALGRPPPPNPCSFPLDFHEWATSSGA
jgi:hypothetical protein